MTKSSLVQYITVCGKLILTSHPPAIRFTGGPIRGHQICDNKPCGCEVSPGLSLRAREFRLGLIGSAQSESQLYTIVDITAHCHILNRVSSEQNERLSDQNDLFMMRFLPTYGVAVAITDSNWNWQGQHVQI